MELVAAGSLLQCNMSRSICADGRDSRTFAAPHQIGGTKPQAGWGAAVRPPHAGLHSRRPLRAAAAGPPFPDAGYRLLRDSASTASRASAAQAPPASERRTGAGPNRPTSPRCSRAAARRTAARDRLPVVGKRMGGAFAALGERAHRRRGPCWPTAWRPTSPAARTMPSAGKGGGCCVFNDVAVAARLMQAEWHRSHGSAVPGLRGGDRPRRAPGQRHGGDLPRRPDGVHALDARRATSRSAGGQHLDVELPDGCGDAPYLAALDAALAQLGAPRHGAAGPGVLPGRRRPARERPPRPPQAHGRRPGRARPARARRLFERRIPVALSMAGGYGRDIGGRWRSSAARCSRRWRAGRGGGTISGHDAPAPSRSAQRLPAFPPHPDALDDNDAYGHVNNVVYYAWFDTAVNGYLIEPARWTSTPARPSALVIETHCNYFARWPSAARGRPARRAQGRSSACATRSACSPTTRARGGRGRHFIHVYVDRPRAGRWSCRRLLNAPATLTEVCA